jgi:hypothetical protein
VRKLILVSWGVFLFVDDYPKVMVKHYKRNLYVVNGIDKTKIWSMPTLPFCVIDFHVCVF